MEKFTLKDIAIPLIKAIDAFNFLLKSHHRRVAIISYSIGKAYGLNNEELANLVVAASIHDIGALSVEERNHLIMEDVDDPEPHCIMASRILTQCDIFKDIAQILRYHHINYNMMDKYDDEIKIQSHILHLADRIDIYISPSEDVLSQKAEIKEKIRRRTGFVFHPEVYEAFIKASNKDSFWTEISQISMEDILSKVDFPWSLEVDNDRIVHFATVMSRIVDFRSHYTATHSYAVAHLANYLGKILKHDDEFCMKLLVAGFLHDIGKLGINPGIIEKKDKLTDEEYKEIKLHSYYTHEILKELSNVEWFSDIVKWATCHHEKTDGSGYPYGLNESDLDEGTMIIAYADVICALMEDRPYRNALSSKEMMKVLKNEEANRLDKRIYKQVIKHLKDINNTVHESQFRATRVYQEPLTKLLAR